MKVRIIDTPPKVFLIGETSLKSKGINDYLAYRELEWNSEKNVEGSTSGIIEFAGRICYESFSNPRGDLNGEYIERTAHGKNHWSITEHAVLNLAIASLPRTTLLELERHRAGTAFSFRSTRYVDTWLEFAVPPLIRGDYTSELKFADVVDLSIATYWKIMEEYKDIPKKRRTEAARAVLPNSLTTDGVFSANVNAFRHIIKLRRHKDADASMIEFAEAVYQCLLHNTETEIGHLLFLAVTGGKDE